MDKGAAAECKLCHVQVVCGFTEQLRIYTINGSMKIPTLAKTSSKREKKPSRNSKQGLYVGLWRARPPQELHSEVGGGSLHYSCNMLPRLDETTRLKVLWSPTYCAGQSHLSPALFQCSEQDSLFPPFLPLMCLSFKPRIKMLKYGFGETCCGNVTCSTASTDLFMVST